jgi:hypothetical protein
MNIRSKIEKWARFPSYAFIVTFLLALTGMLGSVYSAEIGNAFPLRFSGLKCSFWSWKATTFWITLALSSGLFWYRQKALAKESERVNDMREQQVHNLKKQSERLADLVKTMPPKSFLTRYGALYADAQRRTWDVRDSDSEEKLKGAVRRVLECVGELAAIFDGAERAHRYSANIMVVLKPSFLRDEEKKKINSIAMFDKGKIYSPDLQGTLMLRRDLSASFQRTGVAEAPDQKLRDVALTLPDAGDIQCSADGQVRWKVLLGAPITFYTHKPEIYISSEDIRNWFSEEGDFSATDEEAVVNYFASQEEPIIGSFYSQVLLFEEDSGKETEDIPIAVLNMHKSGPNLFRGSKDSIEQFIQVMRPFRILLLTLLKPLHELEKKSGQTETWNIIIDSDDPNH